MKTAPARRRLGRDVLDELLPEDWRDFDDDVTDRMMARSIDG